MDHQVQSEVENLIYWRRAVAMSVLVDAASLVGLVNALPMKHPVTIVRAFSVAWSTAILGVLILRRGPVSLARAAFALVPLPLFPTFWLLMGASLLHDLPFEAFVRQEIVCIVYALATPPSPILSILIIGAFSADALGLLWWIGPHSHLVAAQSWQPWTILLYGTLSIALALYQASVQRTFVAMIIQGEHAGATKRLARAYLAIRDMINTPLQTLKISASLIANRCPDAGDLPKAIARSVDRIDQLNAVFRERAAEIEWGPGDESFDPLDALRTQMPGAK